MKAIAVTIAVGAAISASAQNTSITIALDTVARDSFYLIETVTKGDGKSRPEITTIPHLFRSPKEVVDLLEKMRKESSEAAEKAELYSNASKILSGKADVISGLIEKSPWWAKQ